MSAGEMTVDIGQQVDQGGGRSVDPKITQKHHLMKIVDRNSGAQKWECSNDLCDYIISSVDFKQLLFCNSDDIKSETDESISITIKKENIINNNIDKMNLEKEDDYFRVLELGCGHATPSLCFAKNYFLTNEGTSKKNLLLSLQDYSKETLENSTKPGVQELKAEFSQLEKKNTTNTNTTNCNDSGTLSTTSYNSSFFHRLEAGDDGSCCCRSTDGIRLEVEYLYGAWFYF